MKISDLLQLPVFKGEVKEDHLRSSLEVIIEAEFEECDWFAYWQTAHDIFESGRVRIVPIDYKDFKDGRRFHMVFKIVLDGKSVGLFMTSGREGRDVVESLWSTRDSRVVFVAFIESISEEVESDIKTLDDPDIFNQDITDTMWEPDPDRMSGIQQMFAIYEAIAKAN